MLKSDSRLGLHLNGHGDEDVQASTMLDDITFLRTWVQQVSVKFEQKFRQDAKNQVTRGGISCMKLYTQNLLNNVARG